MALTIKQLLPTSYSDLTFRNAQARVPSELYGRVDKIRKENGWSWPEVITALFEKFCHDFEKPHKASSFTLPRKMNLENISAWK